MASERPKVLHLLAGRPLLAHVIDRARALGAAQTLVVYGHGGEAVPGAFPAPDVAFVLQDPQQGTGHAVQQAVPHLQAGGRTLVLYGDVPLLPLDALQALREAGPCLCLLTAELENPDGYGRIERDARGEIFRIVEERDANDAQRRIREVNTGILCAPTDALVGWLDKLRPNNSQREYYLTDVVGLAVAEGIPVRSVRVSDAWRGFGVNTRAQLADMERRLQREQAEDLMARGMSLADPERLDLRGELECERDVFVDVGCIFEGKVLLKAGVTVGAYCVLRNTVVERDTVIAPFSHIDGAEIGPECRVGPYARLRPGTRLGPHAHVGNFVETKNASLAEGAKANHLSYLGDATIGRGVNVGAGTITCNYDGVNKSLTVIEDGAFIGSNTSLVAPVRVGRDATIGAGSTITQDAPAGELTVARARQITIAGWERPRKQAPGKS